MPDETETRLEEKEMPRREFMRFGGVLTGLAGGYAALSVFSRGARADECCLPCDGYCDAFDPTCDTCDCDGGCDPCDGVCDPCDPCDGACDPCEGCEGCDSCDGGCDPCDNVCDPCDPSG